MARDQAVDENELELDEEGFAGPPARPQARPSTLQGNGGNGSPSRRNGGTGNGSEVEDAQAELARLRAENARLRAVAGLEARRDEPVTVGDLLDANEAQAGYIRSEVERAVEEYGESVLDVVADRVLQRQLEELGVEDEGGAGTTRKGKKTEEPELPLERVTKVSVPRLYQGETEADVVRYLDADTGEELTRKGRRKGGAYGFIVERIED